MKWQHVYFGIEGRISRMTWWLSNLVLWIPWVVLSVLIDALFPKSGFDEPIFVGVILVAIMFLWCIFTIWASICINAKRWHDTDKSGWWQVLGMIPLIGLWTLIENGFFRGTSGANRFGPDPLAKV